MSVRVGEQRAGETRAGGQRSGLLRGVDDAPESEPDPVYEVTVDAVSWSEQNRHHRDGTSGSNMRAKILHVGPVRFVCWTQEADGAQRGYYPDQFPTRFPEVAGQTRHVCELPAGTSTPEEHADLLAAVLAAIPGVVSAVPRVAANSNGTWTIDVTTNLEIAWGARSFASRGPAGLHGGRTCRAGAGTTSIPVTRPIGNLIDTPHADDIPFGVQLQLASTVSTADSARPRMSLFSGTAGPRPQTRRLDWGQIPAAQIVAGQAATLWFTPAQCLAARAYLDSDPTADLWLTAHAVTGTNYAGEPTGGGYEGDQADANIRVDLTNSNDPTASFTTWDTAAENVGVNSFPFLLGARLLVERSPATALSHERVWGSFSDYATHPSDVGWVEFQTCLTASTLGIRGLRILSAGVGLVSGVGRLAIHEGGTTADSDPDNPNMVGSTRLIDLGLTASTGGLVMIAAPTGAGTRRVPSGGMFAEFHGNGVVGRGESGPGPYANTGRRDQPSMWIRDVGANIELCRSELDITRVAPGYGNNAVASESPYTDPDVTHRNVGNHPLVVVIVGTPDIPVVLAA